MNSRITLSFALILCIVIAFAGCTDSPALLATTAPQESVETTQTGTALDMVPTENDPLDAARSVTINVDKDYLGMILVTFQGGPGLVHVRKIDVTVNRADGLVKTSSVGIKLDDSATIEGTKNTDRVMVFVTLSDGKNYKLYDDLVAYKTR
ncbi:MAG: hypothetical protein M0Q92_10620 [Methanoregula sp.]|jgi:hypothetical protein|nr:hypothetical protein [Methanoregula sp.]